MDAVLLAGGIPKPDTPLYAESGGRHKALIDIAGRPMAQWVLDAMDASEKIDNLIIIGLDPSTVLHCQKPMTYLPDSGGLLDNIFVGLNHIRQHSPETTHILLSTTDIPSITGEMVDWLIETAQAVDSDLDYFTVERQTMEARFPGSNRSYIRLRDAELCGGDLHVLRLDMAQKNEFWERVIEARKSIWRQASLVGFDLLFLLLTRRMSLREAESRVNRRLGLDGRVIISPYAEIAMDVDKATQLDLLRQDLEANMGEQ